jgi:ankyrin repeat protein
MNYTIFFLTFVCITGPSLSMEPPAQAQKRQRSQYAQARPPRNLYSPKSGTSQANHDLLSSAASGNLEGVNRALSQAAQPNNCDSAARTALQLAAIAGNKDVVKRLLQAGALVNQADSFGRTPLYWAAIDGHYDAVVELLNASASVNAADSASITALHWASLHGYADIVQELIARGANVNARTGEGYTPLHYAAQEGHYDVVILLLMAGAYVNEVGPSNTTALIFASQKRNDRGKYGRVFEALLTAGADVECVNKFGQTAHQRIYNLSATERQFPTHSPNYRDNLAALLSAYDECDDDVRRSRLQQENFIPVRLPRKQGAWSASSGAL